jgi:hypothetical protein
LTRAQQICPDFSEKYSLRDIQAVRKKSLTSSRRIGRPGPSADFLVSQSDWQEFLSQVDMLLTEQPWPRGIHIEVAEKLHAKKSNVALAIDQLIAAGKYYQQVDGLLFDSDGNEVLLEPKIENSDPQ